MNDIIQIQKDLSKIRKKFARSKCFFALLSAHSLDMAILNAHCAKPTSLDEAQKTSNLINFLWQAETTPYEFMQSIDETANKSIDNYKTYGLALQNCPFNKQVLESFCKWYVNTGWSASKLKCNINNIIYCGMAIQQYDIGKINKKELLKSIDAVAKAGERVFSFKPKGILRAFNQATNKLKEIEQKIQTRQFDYE